MARLDVFRINARQYALDCQSDQLDRFATRFCVPLLRPEDVPTTAIQGFHPTFDIVGQPMVMATHLAGALPARRLKDWVMSLVAHEYPVQRALDLLVSGP